MIYIDLKHDQTNHNFQDNIEEATKMARDAIRQGNELQITTSIKYIGLTSNENLNDQSWENFSLPTLSRSAAIELVKNPPEMPINADQETMLTHSLNHLISILAIRGHDLKIILQPDQEKIKEDEKIIDILIDFK
ncbi:hypothetical protein ACG9X2_10755 [Acinetobacter bereziniae]|uniref:hypothetical protein n=1 Tax=Acinetobacter bereziniae TaxID=106648 RepID=UPI003AF6E050